MTDTQNSQEVKVDENEIKTEEEANDAAAIADSMQCQRANLEQ